MDHQLMESTLPEIPLRFKMSSVRNMEKYLDKKLPKCLSLSLFGLQLERNPYALGPFVST